MVILFILFFVFLLFFVIIVWFSTRQRESLSVPDTAVTVVVCNYKRPHNLEKSLPILAEYPEITEIIVSHNLKENYREFSFPKVKNVTNYRLNEQFGSTSRYFAAVSALSPWILFLDDDHLPSRALIQDLMRKMEENPVGLYGPYTRLCNERGYFQLLLWLRGGYNAVLTPILMTSKQILDRFLQNFHRYAPFLEQTKGNGEDLAFNHHLMQEFGIQAEQVKGSFETLDEDTGSYRGRASHYKVRNRFCRKFHGR